jgi:hypothetical protein
MLEHARGTLLYKASLVPARIAPIMGLNGAGRQCLNQDSQRQRHYFAQTPDVPVNAVFHTGLKALLVLLQIIEIKNKSCYSTCPASTHLKIAAAMRAAPKQGGLPCFGVGQRHHQSLAACASRQSC